MDNLTLFLTACVSWVNLPYTILLIAILIYWAMVILGALDLHAIHVDLDLDADADVHVEMDADADAHVEVEGAHGALIGLLHFFGVGEIPVMILVSFFVLSLWIISVTANYYLGSLGLGTGASIVTALVLFVPNVVVSLFVAKILTSPLRSVFRALSKEKIQHEELCGIVGVVTTREVTEAFGQVEVRRKGAPLKLNCVTRNGQVMKEGDLALLVRHDPATGVYTVEKSDSPV